MAPKIRKPGEPFDLTDKELLQAPVSILTPVQRKRRRALRKREAAKKTARARNDRRARGEVKVIFCQGFRKDGEACGAYAIVGAKHCNNHLNDAEMAKLGKKNPAEARKEKRLEETVVGGIKLTGPQMARMTFEVALEKLLSRYFKAVGMEFAGFDEAGVPVVYDHGASKGLCLYGESKDGEINVTDYPDLAAQIQVIEKLYDRIYGKPKQTNVIEGGVKPVQIQPVRSVERAQAVAGLLRRTGALGPQHEGRRRPDPPGESVQEGEVVPLRPDAEK